MILPQPKKCHHSTHSMMPWPTIAILLTVTAFLALGLLHWPKRRLLQQLPPGPATLPVLGNMHQMLSNKPIFRWIHSLLRELGTDILCLRLGPVHVIAVASPAMALEVLRKNDAAFASRPRSFAAESLSMGYKNTIMSPYGDQWSKMKRMVAAELLSPAMERRLHGRRVEEADHLISYVYSMCIKKPNYCAVDIRYVARHFCGSLIRRLVFGKRHFSEPPTTSNGGPGRDEEAQVDAIFTALNHLGAFCVSDYFPVIVGLDLQGHEKIIKDVMSTFRRLHDPIIQDKIKTWTTCQGNGHETGEAGDFLDVLVSLRDGQGHPALSVEEITAEAIELSLAAIDNPSNAVEWALAEMMNKPDIMKKAVDELDTVVGKDRLVQEFDIPNLNYLKACIREAFRIHPFHPFNQPHVAIADTTIAGYLIPKDSQVLISRIGLGRNPQVWNNPLEFRPERHLLNNANILLTEPDLRFITFGTGRRACPATSLGTSITMMLFARLLQGFTWNKPHGVDRIELRETATGLALWKPLVLEANPRLSPNMYQIMRG